VFTFAEIRTLDDVDRDGSRPRHQLEGVIGQME